MRDKIQESLSDRRVLLLVALVVVSVVLIQPTYGADGFDTGLRYGLQLQGGVWMQLQVQGVTAAGSVDIPQTLDSEADRLLGTDASVTKMGSDYLVEFGGADNQSATELAVLGGTTVVDRGIRVNVSESALVSSYLSDELGAEVRPISDSRGLAYEVRENVDRSAVENAFDTAGGRMTSYRKEVSDKTLSTTTDVIENKVNSIGLRDISVRSAGNRFILVDMAGNISLDRAKEIVSKPGQFELRVETEPAGGLNNSVHAIYGDQINSVDFPNQEGRGGGQWGVPFTLTAEGGQDLQRAVVQTGAARANASQNIIMLLDGEVVYSAPIAPGLKEQFRQGVVRSLRSNTGTGEKGREDATNLQIHLKAGALPIDVDVMSSGQVSPALGENFKVMALLAGLLALVAVSIVTYLRYRRPVVTGAILLVAFSEVLALLGISAKIQDLTLPAIAGIIITVGTGIDHLIVISDQVLRDGRLPTARTFAKRLSTANWIIYGAAFTTVIAMTPLYFMGLGRLSGFAIMTILGIIIGVAITRPAYARLIYILLKRD